MEPDNCNEYMRGKVQYIQENQGFIRCQKKVYKKRDVIFFTKDIAVELRRRIHVGCQVVFHIVCDSIRRNCKGVDITHWAKIDSIVDNPSAYESDRELSLSRTSSPIMDSKSTDESKYHPTGMFSSSLPAATNEDDLQQMRRIINDLYSTVYESIYKTAFVVITNQSSPYRSCWDVL